MQEELNCVQCEHWCGTTADKNRIRVSCYNHIDNCQCNCNSLFLLSWLKPCLCMCNVSSNATKTLRFKPYIWYLNRILYTYTSALVYMKLNAIVLSNREMVCWLLSKCSCVCVCLCFSIFYETKWTICHFHATDTRNSAIRIWNMVTCAQSTHILYTVPVWMSVFVCVDVHRCIRLITK